MRTALFTGAGASYAIGYPLTSELLPMVRERLNNAELFEITANADAVGYRKELRDYLIRLLPGFDDIEAHDLPLITDVFSLVEYSIISGEALSIGDDKALRRCRDLLKQAMTDIFLENFNRDYDPSKEDETREEKVLHDLAAWIKARKQELGLVTTNYDIGVEYALYGNRGYDIEAVDMGFDWRDPSEGYEHTRPRRPDFRIYKLHGSFNLLRCSTCGYVYFNSDGSIAHQAFRKKLDRNNTCHCRNDIRLELQIISPSLVRDVRDANLLSIWRSALEWMRTAERWVIVGYSLPPEDLAIRSLLLRAYATAKTTPKVTVVQFGNEAKRHYRLLFPKCDYRDDGLERFLSRE